MPSLRHSSQLIILLTASVLACAPGAKTATPSPDAGNDPDAGGMDDAGQLSTNGIGSGCTQDSDCASNHCDLQPTGGYCIDACTTNSSCPEGSVCQQLGRGTAYCLDACRTAAECRNGYTCQDIASTCVPASGCQMDSDCPEGTTCNEFSGLCTGAIGPVSHVGATCMRDSQCTVGPYPFCIGSDMHFTDGYCSSVCSNDGQCGARGICVGGLVTGQNYSICMQSCTADADCRAQYNCVERNSQKFCLAWCVENSDCVDPGTICEPSTGLCHADPDAGPADAGPMDVDAGTDPGDVDAGPPEHPWDGGYPAQFPAPPKVAWFGGPVLQTPKFIPIFFANDVPDQVEQIEDFDYRVGASSWWAAVTADYHVGPAVSSPSIHLDEVSSGTITDDDIQQWLRDRINSGVLPAPDSSSMYLLHYPWSMTIMLQGSRSCRSFGAYHSNFRLGTKQVVYAVMPRCGGPHDDSTVGTETLSESHEMIEAATDPQPFGSPAYGTVEDAYYYWAQFIGGGEVADMCQNDSASYVISAELGHGVQRSWSNSSAAAGHDPCVPALAGEVYFAAAPELNDTYHLFQAQGFINVKSAHVPAGGSTTIGIDLYSDGDTGGPWDVSIRDLGSLTGADSPFRYKLDHTSGQNGDRLHLTITSVAGSPRNGAFSVRSTLNGRTHSWIGLADQ